MRFASLIFCLFVMVLLQARGGFASATMSEPGNSGLVPRHILQGPLYQGVAPPEDPYWFQVGAVADNSTKHFTGVNITIRTTYDKIILADHSYWIGSFLSNGAFIQVGYLTTLSTDNRPYCCAWFYEYFPPFAANPPVIGPAGSAGPIGAWHTYSMLSLGNGTWTFYMDGQPLGLPQYVEAKDSGDYVANPTAEVAGADNNHETLGPAEFRDFQVRLSDGWQPVPSAKSLIFYAAGTRPYLTPRNPYGVWEVEGVNNDFLAGSNIPQPSPVQPMPGATLWPVPTLSYHKVNFTFIDNDRQPFTPSWVALRDKGNWSLYTNFQNQLILPAPSGKWTLDSVMWHTVNVTPEGVQLSIPETTSLTVQGNVFSAIIQVLGALYSLPVSGATVQTTFPDSLTSTQKTDSSGQTILRQVPPGNYTLQIGVPYGIPAFLSTSIQGPGTTTVRVLGMGEMIMILLPPAAAATIVARIAIRGGRRMPGNSPPSSGITNHLLGW